MSERQKKRLAQKEANRLKRRMIEKVLSTSKTSNLAFNLNLLVDGWLELESDPGTFSLLIEDFGCFGAQVDEIYDLEQKFEGPVLGFIFLFKWLNNQQNDRLRNQKSTSSNISTNTINNNNNNSTINNDNNNSSNNNNNKNDREQQLPDQRRWSYVEDENIISKIFFAKQMISNSCATHALISILLNCDYDELNLGPTLTRLKEHTKIMDPENKGYAIGNLPELAKAHNSHASYTSHYNRNKPHSNAGMSYVISGNQRTSLQQQNQPEAYHFVSYVPINNRLYELDGLKNYPIDHGPFGPNDDWTEKFRSVIKQRLVSNKTGDDSTVSNDIRYSLMAVVPDKRVCLRSQLRKLKHHQDVVKDSITRLTKRVFSPLSVDIDIPNPPYSPLSNGTLTASESGSAYNSPTHYEDGFFSEDDNKIDKYFCIKFDQRADVTTTNEENSQPAHKSCIIEVESTSVIPVDLKVKINGDDERMEESKSNLKPALNNCKNEIEDSEKKHDLKSDNEINDISNGLLTVQQETKTNGVVADNVTEMTESSGSSDNHVDEASASADQGGDAKVNQVQAHNDEKKYNLSTKPPFDFNILDEMQHVHFGKSTLKDMTCLSKRLMGDIEKLESSLKEEIEKRRKYKIDNSRRTHNYEPFIMTFLSMLAKQGKLADLIEKDLGMTSESTAATTTNNSKATSTPAVTAPTSSSKPAPCKIQKIQKHGTTTTKVSKYKYVSTGRPVGRPRKHPKPPEPNEKPSID